VINNRLIYIYGGGGQNSTIFNSIHILEIDPEPQMLTNKIPLNVKLSNNIKNMFNNTFLSDVQIIVENRVFHCHKIILSLLCEKFRYMFSTGLNESSCKELYIKSYHAKHFETLLKYLYSGDIEKCECENYALPDFIEILKISDEYMLTSLKEWSETHIIKLIDVNNFLVINNFANKFSAENLVSYCDWFFRNYKDNISMQSLDISLSDLSFYSQSLSHFK
jgi:hypothetical protein